jgi:ABC-type sugar transport system ATPase subunit
MTAVALRDLTKSFDGGAPVLDHCTLDVESGEFLVILGPSGCGKTTVLRCIAGLETPTAGEVHIDGRRVDGLPPRDRDVAMVFQNYALYPHLTARQNIAFPLRMRRTSKAEIAARVAEAAEVLGITGLLDRRPAALSGGERQRVALGRAIVRHPKVFLFDEPLSNLDAQLRSEMRAELLALHRRLGRAMLYVTHDQTEAMTMGRRIALLRAGRLQQVGTPAEIYARPANAFVAGFLGNPGMNVIGARSEERGARESAFVGFRPEDARLGGVEGTRWTGTVMLVEPLGSETLVHVRLTVDAKVIVRVREGEVPAVDAVVGLQVSPERLHHFDASGTRL